MFIKRENIQKNPETLFVFGDNDLREGMGGMAKEFRGEPNSIGIRTKKAPSNKEGAFYTDDEYEENCRKIDEDIEAIKKERKKYLVLCIPEGIGEGLSCLQKRAPKTLEYLKKQLKSLQS